MRKCPLFGCDVKYIYFMHALVLPEPAARQIKMRLHIAIPVYCNRSSFELSKHFLV
jgi:hypothetical protein